MARNRSESGRRYAAHWDKIAPRWGEEVFNTLLAARNRVVVAELKTAARSSRSIVDFGCGIGTYLPMLSRLFEEVHGFEQSPKCVRIAKSKMRGRSNVTVRVAHRVTKETRSRYDAALCVNVAIHPSKREWRQVLRSLFVMLGPGGRLLLVVPSLESGALVARAQELDADTEDVAPAPSDRMRARIQGGIVRFGGVPTKHFQQKELRAALVGLGLEAVRLRRVEYSWASHGITPAREFKTARPWDWLAVARKPGNAKTS